MKNYYPNPQVPEDFILYFTDNIHHYIVYYADKNIKVIPKTINNKNELLRHMEYQVLFSSRALKDLKEENSLCYNSLVLDSCLLLSFFTLAKSNMNVNNPFVIMVGIILFNLIISNLITLIINYRKIIDIEKQKLYLKNKKLLAKMTINDMDQISYHELTHNIAKFTRQIRYND